MDEAADDLQRAQEEAFAQLTEVARRLEDDQLEAAAAAGARFLAAQASGAAGTRRDLTRAPGGAVWDG